jgi:SsrA-binding protein
MKREQSLLDFKNRKASYDFQIFERMEVGVMLKGWEIKAIRAGRMSLAGSWVKKVDSKWVWNSEITPLEQASTHCENKAIDNRTLLMKRTESDKWSAKVKEKGYTVIPLSGYFKGAWFKLEIGLAKGKQEHDKRNSEKESDAKKEMAMVKKKMIKSVHE